MQRDYCTAPAGIWMWCALVAGVLLALPGCQTVPQRPHAIARGNYAAVKDYASQLIASEMSKHDVTGLSIALVDDQKVVWAQGFGYADKAREIPATPETVYRVGSISKLFTATAVLQLAEQGKLDIDQPLRTYLPEFAVEARDSRADITPHNIMTHHSGLPRDYLAGMWTAKPEPFTTLASRLPPDSAAYPPNLLFSYSNVGVTLLGHAVQNVSGKPFPSYLQSAVLQPLGMAHSSFSAKPPDIPQMSKGYREGHEAREPALRDVPAGGLNASVLDLGRFVSMVFAEGKVGEKTVLKADTMREMLRPQNEGVALDLNFRTGLAWMLSGLGGIDIENAGTIAHHAGATFLFHGQLISMPEHRLGVVVLANSATSGPAVNKVAVEALKLALQAKTGIAPKAFSEVASNDQPLADEIAQAFAGDYATLAGYVHIEHSSGDLQAEAAGKSFFLDPRTDGMLGLRYALFGFIPIRIGEELDRIALARKRIDGREVVVAQMGKQQMLIGEKIQAVPISEKWLGRLGDYEVANLNHDEPWIEGLRLRQENGFLLGDITASLLPGEILSIPIIPTSDEKANVAGMLHDYGETVRIVSGNGEERLLFSGYEFRRKAR